MSRVVLDISPSLDGYVAGHGRIAPETPFGEAGHRLHRWIGFEDGTPDAVDDAAARRMFADAGAVVLGRRMFDVGIDHWGEDGAFGLPCFVVTNRAREPLRRGPTRFEFVGAHVAEAIALARAAAGGREVIVVGGADIARQCLQAGLVDELRLHVVPVLLGRGVRLFEAPLPALELELLASEASVNAMHQTYRVRVRD